MGICDNIQYIGNTLETNLNNLDVDCTFGIGTGEQNIYNMVKLINEQNIRGIGDTNIQIIPNRPYVTSGETIDVTVRLLDGVGNPLSNKNITISDGTNSYNGITDKDGIYTLFNQTITTTTTYTVTYGTETKTAKVQLCEFVDYGVTNNNNSNIWYTNNATITREATYTNIKATANWGSAYLGNPSTNTPTNLLENNDEIIIELQAHNTFVKGTKGFNVRWYDGTNHYISFQSGIGHHKMVLSKTRVDMYLDDVWKEGYNLNNIPNAYLQSVANVTDVEVQFSDFRIYTL